MTNTDWRSEFDEKFEIGAIKYFKPLPHFTMYTRDLEIKKFIEQSRIEAQIEVLEESMKFQEDLCDGLGDIGNWTEDKIEELKQK